MAKGLVMVTLLSDTPTKLVLVTWTSAAPVLVPTATEPNDTLVGETATGAGGSADADPAPTPAVAARRASISAPRSRPSVPAFLKGLEGARW